jgi:hypothetical protein
MSSLSEATSQLGVAVPDHAAIAFAGLMKDV